MSPGQPLLPRQPSAGKHTHFLLGKHPYNIYLHSASSTTLQAGFQNHRLLSSLPYALFPEQGLPNPLTFIMSGCFCCAPHLLPIKNNSLSKVYLKSLWFIKHIFLQSVQVPLKGEQVQCQ